MRGILKISGYFLISANLTFFSPPNLKCAFHMSPARAEAETSAGKEAKAENIVIAEPAVTFKIKSLRVLGSTLSNSDLAALFDSKSTQPLSERLHQLTADTIVIPELNVEKTGELSELLTYRDVKLEQVAGGIAAKASAAEANFTIKGTQEGFLSGAYGKMQAESFDLSLAAAMMTEAGSNTGVSKTLLYKAFTVDGFTFANPKAEFAMSVKEMSGQDIKARPLHSHLPEAAEDADAVPPESRLSDYLAMVLGGFDIGNAQTKGLHTAVRSGERSITLVLDEIKIHDLINGRIAKAELKGFDLQTEKTNVKLNDLSIGNIDLRPLGLPAEQQSASTDDKKNAGPSNLLSAANSLSLSGLDVIVLPVLAGESLTPDGEPSSPPKEELNALGAKASGFAVAKAEMQHSPMKDDSPEQFAATFSNLIVKLNPAAEPDGSFNALANLGYSNLDLSGGMELTLNKAKVLHVSDLTLSGVNLGKLKASLIAEHVTGDVLSPDPAIAEAALHEVVFKHLELHLDNFGLLSKVIAHQAEVQNKTIGETRESYVTAAGMIVPVLLGGGPASKEIGNAVAKFISDPKSFHMIANAPLGLTFADLSLLQDPAALMKKVDIEVSAGP